MDGGNAGNAGRLYGYRRLKMSVTNFPAIASALSYRARFRLLRSKLRSPRPFLN